MSKIINLQSAESLVILLSQARQMVIMHEGEIYKFFDEGCTRFVYVNDDYTKVIKMNKDKYTDYNKEEAEIYNKASEEDKVQMCPTKLVVTGFVEQKFVTPIKYGGKKLNKGQLDFANSCRNEVGWDENGELVCFDLDEFKKYL